jgi:peptidoglycan L-alanyl-D-glutamate endopeptidase CwlK
MGISHIERVEKLQPVARVKARAAFQQAEEEGLSLLVTSGLRSFAEQDALFALGRTKPGKVVTDARAGESYHNFGLAFDFVVVIRGHAVWDASHAQWKRFVRIAKSLGFDWGGDLNSDNPHFQIKNPPSVASLRTTFPQGYRPGGEIEEVPRDRLPLFRGHINGEKKLVSELQRGLGIRVNGRFGGRTESAVIDWQAIHNKRGEVVPFGKGLTIDGRVDRKTWDSIFVVA